MRHFRRRAIKPEQEEVEKPKQNRRKKMASCILAVVSGPVVVLVAYERRIGPCGGHGGGQCSSKVKGESYRALWWFRWLIWRDVMQSYRVLWWFRWLHKLKVGGSRIGPFGGSGGSSED